MSHVLVIGGGLSGCVTANELSQKGCKVSLIEKTNRIGGKVREYGCKATDKCNNCGVCLAGGIWEKVEKNSLVDILTETVLSDVIGEKGNFSVVLKSKDGYRYINGVSKIVVAAGFESQPNAHLQISGTASRNIMSGIELEKTMLERRENLLLENRLGKTPKSVAFIQCFGSRDKKEQALYCSRVCCGYSTRASKVIRQYYPETEITFFYMELQEVFGGNYYSELASENMEFIKCRPLKVKGGDSSAVIYEDPKTGKITERNFDLIVLSEGIHPSSDSGKLAELCKLSQDKHGFLQNDEVDTGVYVVGCAAGPAKIEEAYSDSIAAAKRIMNL